jgi:hypothetical protein
MLHLLAVLQLVFLHYLRVLLDRMETMEVELLRRVLRGLRLQIYPKKRVLFLMH